AVPRGTIVASLMSQEYLNLLANFIATQAFGRGVTATEKASWTGALASGASFNSLLADAMARGTGQAVRAVTGLPTTTAVSAFTSLNVTIARDILIPNSLSWMRYEPASGIAAQGTTDILDQLATATGDSLTFSAVVPALVGSAVGDVSVILQQNTPFGRVSVRLGTVRLEPINRLDSSAALALGKNAQLRFVPAAGFTGQPGLLTVSPLASVSGSGTLATATSGDGTRPLDLTAYVGAASAKAAAPIAIGSSVLAPVRTNVGTLAVPDVPTNLTVSLASDGVPYVEWSAPASDGGAAISNYVVQESGDSGLTWFGCVTTNGSTYRVAIDGLSGEHSFRVAAENSAGVGNFSSPTTTVSIPALPSLPIRLTHISGTAVNSSDVLLSWTLADNKTDGSLITGISVQASIDGGRTWIDLQPSTWNQTSATVTGLTAGSSPLFRVAIVNAQGFGKFSEPSDPVVLTAAGLAAPTNVTGTVNANGTITLRWSPSQGDPRFPITDYQVELSTDGNTWQPVTDGTSSTSEVILSGVSSRLPCAFRVRAISAIAVSEHSASVTLTPPTAGAATPIIATATPPSGSAAPSAPLNPYASPSGDMSFGRISDLRVLPGTFPGSLQVSWNDSSATQVDVDDYVIEVSPDNGKNWSRCNDGTSSATFASLSSLTSTASYVVRVAASINGHVGPWTPYSAAVIPQPSSSFPTFVTVGDAGNAPNGSTTEYNTTGRGAVPYEYGIGKYEITIDEYCDFLNAVAQSGSTPLWPLSTFDNQGGISRTLTGDHFTYSATGPVGTATIDGANSAGKRPVVGIDQSTAMRFCNWLHNGKPRTGVMDNSTTENGAYRLGGSGAILRNPGALYAIPTIDEWYKAAYYKSGGLNAGYWKSGTSSDTDPLRTLSSRNTATHSSNGLISRRGEMIRYSNYRPTFATYRWYYSSPAHPAEVRDDGVFVTQNLLTNVDAFPLSKSPYGALGMHGNAGEVFLSADGTKAYSTGFLNQSFGYDLLKEDGYYWKYTDKTVYKMIDYRFSTLGAGLRIVALNPSALSAYTATPLPVPEPPQITNIQLTDTGSTIAWAMPNPGPAPTGFCLQYSQDDGRSWQNYSDNIAATMTSTTIHTRFTEKSQIRVAAKSAAGIGAFSDPFIVKNGNDAIPAFSGRTATVSWSSPISAGAEAISFYEVESSTDGGATWLSEATTTELSLTIADVPRGQSFVYRVRARNSSGAGPWAVTTAETVVTNSVPDVVSTTGLTAVRVKGGYDIHWAVPESGGTAITDYIVQYSYNSGENWWAYADGTTASNAASVIQSTTNDDPVKFRVAAVNAIGVGAFSEGITSTISSGVPTAPGTPSSTAPSGRIALTWVAPSNSGASAIEDYVIQGSKSGESWTTIEDGGKGMSAKVTVTRGASTAVTATISGLLNGFSYVFRVAAVNNAGRGPYSLSSASAVPSVLPGDTVAALFRSNFIDVNGDSLAGVAIVDNAAAPAQGAWQYSTTSGASWSDVPISPSAAAALMLDASAKLRFVPAKDFKGQPGSLSARLIDSSFGTIPSNAQQALITSTAISDGTVALTTSVGNAIPPTDFGGAASLGQIAPNTATGVARNVSQLISTTTARGDSAPQGLAVINNAATSAQGAWQYSTDGGTTWATIPSNTETGGARAVEFLDASVRFYKDTSDAALALAIQAETKGFANLAAELRGRSGIYLKQRDTFQQLLTDIRSLVASTVDQVTVVKRKDGLSLSMTRDQFPMMDRLVSLIVGNATSVAPAPAVRAALSATTQVIVAQSSTSDNYLHDLSTDLKQYKRYCTEISLVATLAEMSLLGFAAVVGAPVLVAAASVAGVIALSATIASVGLTAADYQVYRASNGEAGTGATFSTLAQEISKVIVKKIVVDKLAKVLTLKGDSYQELLDENAINSSLNLGEELIDLARRDTKEGTVESLANDIASDTEQKIHSNTDNLTPVTISIAGAMSVSEGNNSTTFVHIPVTLSRTTNRPVTVRYTTVNGTATGGFIPPTSDYMGGVGESILVTIPAGSQTGFIDVPVYGDDIFESDETFIVKISSPTNALLGSTISCAFTIKNDDTQVFVSIQQFVSVSEGAKEAFVPVSLSRASQESITVNWATQNGSAIIGSDYGTSSGVVTFAPGETSKTLIISIY
ncbi:hypothetical protein D4R49_01070, partial [bacterium]